MICIIALVVFGILGIFSATHRRIALEALDCVLRRVSFRKCESALDVRLKSAITGKLLTRSPAVAGFIYRHFEWFSWALIMLTIISTYYTAVGGYNYYLYGNCNGPEDTGFCIFDPTGENNKFSTCSADSSPDPKFLTLSNVDLSIFPGFDRKAANDVIFIGCYACPYTRESYPAIKQLLERDDVNFIFAHSAVKEKTELLSYVTNCIYEMDKQEFIKFNDLLFKTNISQLSDRDYVFSLVGQLGMDVEKVKQCADSNATIELANKQFEELKKTGMYGTPTVFINGKALVGPKPYRVYALSLK